MVDIILSTRGCPSLKRRRFDNKFKMEAVKLVLETKRSVVAVARELGIHANEHPVQVDFPV